MRRLPFAALLAATALAVAVGGIGVVAAPQARAAAGTVAIVISYSGGADVTRCVAAGGTGDSILNSVASVAYRRDGLIVKINSTPSSGLADNTHYWAYFHNTGSGWAYSNVGASSYRPAPGTVEGWRYSNGANPGPNPPSLTYSQICSPPAPPTTAAPPVVPAPPQTTAVPRVTSSPPARTVSAVPQPVLPPASADVTTPPVSSGPADPSSSATGSVSESPGSDAPTSISASPVGARAKSSGGGSIAAVLIGAVLVAGLASTAIVIARRRRAS
jgi:hypothetical protein